MLAHVRDTTLFFDVGGPALVDGESGLRELPTLFALHGGPGVDHSLLKPALGGLGDRAQVLYVDHRGNGRSARGPSVSYTLENHVLDLEALRIHLGLERIAVLGISYGGAVALAYAARFPESVSHLIAATAPLHAGFIAVARHALAERGTPEQVAIAEHLWEGTFADDDHLRDYLALMGPLYSRTSGSAVGGRRPMPILSHAAINQAFRGSLRGLDLRPELWRITAPTLIVAGRHDWICPPEHCAQAAALIPDAGLLVLEESSHAVLTDQLPEFLTAVRELLTTPSSPGRPRARAR